MLSLPKFEDIKIISVDATIKTPYQFDLDMVAANLLYADTKLYRSSLSVRMQNYPNLVLHLTEDGLIILAGNKTISETKSVAEHVFTYIKEKFLPDFTFNDDMLTYSISGTFNIGYEIDLKKLHDYSTFMTQYHPDGNLVNLKMSEPKIKFIIHASGKIDFDHCEDITNIQLGLIAIIPTLFTFRVGNDLTASPEDSDAAKTPSS